MKKFISSLVVVGLLVVPLLAVGGLAKAQGVRGGQLVNIKKDESFDGTLFSAARTLDISGTINGDVFCAGQDVTISGTVHGDVICAAQNLRISGVVEGDARLAGQQVNIDGEIQHNLSVAGQNFTLEGKGKVLGDVMSATQTSSYRGSIGRDLGVASETATLSGSIGRTVKMTGTQLVLTDGASIAGDLNYTSSNDLRTDRNVVITGATHHTQPPAKKAPTFASRLGWLLLVLSSMLLMGLFLVAVFRKNLVAATDNAKKHTLQTLLVGLFALFAVPVAAMTIMFTVVGLPIGIFLILMYMAILVASASVSAFFIGKMLPIKSTNPALTMLAGTVILFFAYLAPILGGLVVMAALSFGLGTIALQLFSRRSKATTS